MEKKLMINSKEADVVVEGYRPSVMEKYGLGRDDIFDLVKDRGRGIIHVKENCYGWNGPWQGRSGWQQISDAVRCHRRVEAFSRFVADLLKSAVVSPGHMARRWGLMKLSLQSFPTQTTGQLHNT
jgi:hypothetical protein